MRKITAYFDGSCERNPGGRIGYGALINGVVELWDGEPENDFNSNNVAEHKALGLILDWLDKNDVVDAVVEIIGDSQMTVNQMTGRYRIHPHGYYYKAALQNLQARDFLKKHNRIQFQFKWVPREQNTLCDALSNKYYQQCDMKAESKGPTLDGKPVVILPCVEPKYQPKKKRKGRGHIAAAHKNFNSR